MPPKSKPAAEEQASDAASTEVKEAAEDTSAEESKTVIDPLPEDSAPQAPAVDEPDEPASEPTVTVVDAELAEGDRPPPSPEELAEARERILARMAEEDDPEMLDELEAALAALSEYEKQVQPAERSNKAPARGYEGTQIAWDGRRYPLDEMPTLDSREDIAAAVEQLQTDPRANRLRITVLRAADVIGHGDLIPVAWR